MIEVSIENIVLILWAAIATASWLHARDDARIAKKMLHLFIENKDARQQIIDAHEKWVREHGDA